MPRRTFTDFEALDALLRTRERVVTHRELRELGVPPSTITNRIRPRGPWQRILPGVVIAHRGTPTARERTLAALRYAGPGAVISGLSALTAQQVRTSRRAEQIVVLVPHTSQRSSFGFVTIRRCRARAATRTIRGVPYAVPARAVVDECREMADLDDVRELVATVIQGRHCELRELAAAVYGAARQRTALSRDVLREMSAGVRAVSEAKAREIMRRGGIPQPHWNCEILTTAGDLIAVADGLWEDVMAALEIDSMAWHLSPARYKQTQRRQPRLVISGVPVLPVAPGDILDMPEQFLREMIEFRAAAAGRELPDLLVRPSTQAAAHAA